MRVHTICETHGTTALVGPGTLISELECVTCIAEQDEANRWRPCCPQMNTTCCGHDDWEPVVFYVEIVSPDYCDVDHERESAEVPF
jgi:hypothetical protein